MSAINIITVYYKDISDNLFIQIRNCIQFPALCLHLSLDLWADHSLHLT